MLPLPKLETWGGGGAVKSPPPASYAYICSGLYILASTCAGEMQCLITLVHSQWDDIPGPAIHLASSCPVSCCHLWHNLSWTLSPKTYSYCIMDDVIVQSRLLSYVDNWVAKEWYFVLQKQWNAPVRCLETTYVHLPVMLLMILELPSQISPCRW